MKIAEFENGIIAISEKDWEKTLRRFDYKNAIELGTIKIIKIPCTFCQKFECLNCPINTTSYSCTRLIEHIIERDWKYRKGVLDIGCNSICWDKENDKTAYRYLWSIRNALLSMRKVSRKTAAELKRVYKKKKALMRMLCNEHYIFFCQDIDD